MLKILSAAQIKALDAYTIEQGSIASIDLMERACRAFVNWFVEHFDNRNRIGIVCGTGNNGGDGLGVARMLRDRGFIVKVWVIRGTAPETADFKTNFEQAVKNKVEMFEISGSTSGELFNECEILVDAVFGTGLSRRPEGIYADVIRRINSTPGKRVAIDIPSGLMADKVSEEPIVRADYTVSFQLPKLSFLLPQSYPYVGDWTLVDIGLSKEFIRQADTTCFYLNQKDPRKILRVRSKFDHKGNFGHSLLIAGSLGKMGAAILSSRAALRAGTGLLTVHVPACGYTALQIAVPEAMVSVDDNENVYADELDSDKFSVIGVGPGIGTSPHTVKALGMILRNFRKPMVIDADALNILSENRELLQVIPAGSILTPHPKEFERISGKWQNDFERLELQRKMASDLKSVIVLKGAHTSIAAPDGKVYFNSTGNPGMATAGSGDVLTGILTGLLAQHYEPIQAAQLGVFLHGLAGDLAIPEMGINSLIASDIIDFLPTAFLRFRRD